MDRHINEDFLDAFQRCRRTIVTLCILCILFGGSLIGLGVAICRQLEEWTDQTYPRVYLIGLLPALYAVAGIVCVAINRRAVMLVWLFVSLCAVPLSMVDFTRVGFFDSQRFWVYLQIYGACITEEQVCRCTWQPGVESRHVAHASSCEQVRLVTTLYLVLIGTFIVSLVTMVIATGLGFVMTIGIQHCISKKSTYPGSTSVATIGNGITNGLPNTSLKPNRKSRDSNLCYIATIEEQDV